MKIVDLEFHRDGSRNGVRVARTDRNEFAISESLREIAFGKGDRHVIDIDTDTDTNINTNINTDINKAISDDLDRQISICARRSYSQPSKGEDCSNSEFCSVDREGNVSYRSKKEAAVNRQIDEFNRDLNGLDDANNHRDLSTNDAWNCDRAAPNTSVTPEPKQQGNHVWHVSYELVDFMFSANVSVKNC